MTPQSAGASRSIRPADPAVLRHVLRAALLEEAAARAAFADWLTTNPPDDPMAFDVAERRLLPLLAANLRSLGITHPIQSAGESVGKQSAARNAQLMQAAGDVVSRLASAGVPTLVLKGVPVIVRYYRDPALRPMSDVDLMVRPSDLLRALRILADAGWTIQGGRTNPRLLPFLYAFEHLRPDRAKLDLHQYLIEHGSSPQAERQLWERAERFDLLGQTCATPDPTDLLLHVCVAGLKAGRQLNSRWMADAYLIVTRHTGSIDWDRLAHDTRERRLLLPVHRALLALVTTLDAPVPPDVLGTLQRARVHRTEPLTDRLLARHSQSMIELAQEYVGLYRSGARAAGRRPRVGGLPAFCVRLLVHRWGLASAREVPRMAIRRLISRATRRKF